MVTRYINAEVEVDLSDFDDDDLMDEIERRGLDLNTKYVDGDTMRNLLTNIWLKRRMSQNFDKDLDDMIYYGLGKVL